MRKLTILLAILDALIVIACDPPKLPLPKAASSISLTRTE